MKKLILIILFLPLLLYSQIINLSDNESTSINPKIISNKNIIYTFWKDNNDGNYDIYFRFSFEGNWSDIMKINTFNNMDLSSICIDDSNYVHIFWIENDSDKTLIYGRIIDSTLIDSIEIYETDTSNIGFVSSFFDEATKQLHVTFEVNSIDTSYTYYLLKDKDNIWSNKQIIISNKFGNRRAQIVKDKDNKIVCLWFDSDSLNINMMNKIDTSWVLVTKLTNEFPGIGFGFVVINDDSLNIQLVSYPGGLMTCPCNYLLYSEWNGYQWSDIEAVPSDDEHAYNTEHNFPNITCTKNNYPVISWQQNSYDIYLNFYNNFIGTAVKTDVGWHVNRSLKFNRPEKPSIFVDNDNIINYVWQDSAGGNYDIYYYKTQLLTSINTDKHLTLPGKIILNQNYPNPFNPSTKICFYLPISSNIDLSIYNIIGQKIKTLYNGVMNSGKKEISWDGRNNQGEFASSGIYIYSLKSSVSTISKKMILIK